MPDDPAKTTEPDKPDPPKEPAKPEPKKDEPLGEAGKAALDKERDARKAAEKAQKAAEAKAEQLEREKMTETDRLKAEAADGRVATEAANATLRQAKLLLALSEQGLAGAKAKAAVRLLDGIEYDDEHEPTNLVSRITAAKAEFGEDLFKGATPPENTEDPPKPGDKNNGRPNTHQGRRRDADPSEDELMGDYLKTHFPQAAPAETS